MELFVNDNVAKLLILYCVIVENRVLPLLDQAVVVYLLIKKIYSEFATD